MSQFYWFSPHRATAGGDVLNLDDFDEVIDAVPAPCLIMMPEALLSAWLDVNLFAEDGEGANVLTQDVDFKGEAVHYYNELPILASSELTELHILSASNTEATDTLEQYVNQDTEAAALPLLLKLVELAAVTITGIEIAAPTA